MASIAYAQPYFPKRWHAMNRGPKPGYLRLVDAAEAVDESEDGRCGGRTSRRAPCARPAGWGTDHPGEGRCRDHRQAPRVMPCLLPLSPLQEELWDDLTRRLQLIGVLREAFWIVVYGLVVALSQLHHAREALAEGELAVPGKRGRPKKAPAATIANQMLSQVRSYCGELGITPSALAKIGPPKSAEPSKLDRLIRGD